MTAKQFLLQYQLATDEAKRLRKEYKKELALIDNIRSGLGGDGTPKGNGINKRVEIQAVKLADKAREWERAEIEALRIRQHVFEVINQVPGEFGNVLFERYINIKTWDDVAESVHYSKRQAINIHDKALIKVESIIAREE